MSKVPEANRFVDVTVTLEFKAHTDELKKLTSFELEENDAADEDTDNVAVVNQF